jgi:hypothetical protein
MGGSSWPTASATWISRMTTRRLASARCGGSDLWITPGLQLAIDPLINPSVDVIAIPQIKARLFF